MAIDGLIQGAPKKYRGLAWFAGVAISLVTAALIMGARSANLSDSVADHEQRIRALEKESRETHDTVLLLDDRLTIRLGLPPRPRTVTASEKP